MDCPSCGLANPVETIKCDCGYDFSIGKPSEVPGWEITLAWRQKLAAYWSISWPGLLMAMFTFTLLLSLYSDNELVSHPVRMQIQIQLACSLAFWGPQAILLHRLVRKNYRSFRIVVSREGQPPARQLTAAEVRALAFRLIGLQISFVLMYALGLALLALITDRETIRSFGSLLIWLQFLAFGPIAVGIALRAPYAGFRLQAYGLRYI